jgi:hypothetical protein
VWCALYRYDDGANRSWKHPNDQWSVQIAEEVHGSQEPHQSIESMYLATLNLTNYYTFHMKIYTLFTTLWKYILILTQNFIEHFLYIL